MAKFFDVVCVGGAVEDITFYTDQAKIISTPDDLSAPRKMAFEYGAKINPKETHFTYGGGAANSAVSLAQLGFKVSSIARVGRDDSGRMIVAELKKSKVETNLIQIDPKLHTGFSVIIALDKKDREHVAFVSRGANNNLVINTSNYSRLASRWFYLTSLSGDDWFKSLKAVFAVAQAKSAKIFWNPGGLQLNAGFKILNNFIKQTQVLMLNKDEAVELVLSGIKLGRKNPNHLSRPIYLLNILHEWGPKIVVITDGVKGAWAYDGKKIYHQKIYKTKVINTVGVGDAFGSAFLAGLLAEKNNVGRALKWGVVNSGSVSAKVGAQAGLLSRSELLKKIK